MLLLKNSSNLKSQFKIYNVDFLINFLILEDTFLWTNHPLKFSFFSQSFFIYFLRNKINFISNHTYFSSLFSRMNIYTPFYHFKWYRFVLFSGLGYKKKYFKTQKIMFSYIADRHWILYKFTNQSSIIAVKKRNFIFVSKSKGKLTEDYYFFSGLRHPYIYKMKGFLDHRVRRKFIFIRRLKLRGVKTKLSKKQQML